MSTSNSLKMGMDSGKPASTPDRNGTGYGFRGFYQPKFEQILRAGLKRFPGVSIRCLSITQNADHAVAELQEDHGTWEPSSGNELVFASKPVGGVQTVRAKFVIGCDGTHSVVREAMGPVAAYLDLDFDERWWATDVKLLDEASVWGTKVPKNRSSIDLQRSWDIVPLWQATDSVSAATPTTT